MLDPVQFSEGSLSSAASNKDDIVSGSSDHKRRRIGAVLALMLLAACGGERAGEPLDTFTAQQIFELGERQISQGDPDDAAFTFGEIERLYPYSEFAQRALIMQAYAYHNAEDYPNSRATAQRYLDFYPAEQDAPYAAYLLALSYYDQIDEVGRDQGLTFQALQALRRVIEAYPDSEYAGTAVLKFDLAFDHLAAKEMEIGRYYLKRGQFAAAANRFRTVVEDFQTTTHTPEALHRLVETYLTLGLDAEAQTAGAILGHNYRSTEWYEASFILLTGEGLNPNATGDNWLASIYRQVLRGEWL